MSIRYVLAVLILAIALTPGCGKKKTRLPAPTVATNAAAEPGGIAAPSRNGLVRLTSESNAYIRNNAKAALASWDEQDYTSAVIAVQKIMSLCESEAQREAALSSLAQLKQDIDAAAAKGDANAKEAAAQLAR